MAADLAQFEEERAFPFKNVQFLQSLLSGLPISAKTQSYIEPSATGEAVGGIGNFISVLDEINKRLTNLPSTTKTETETGTA